MNLYYMVLPDKSQIGPMTIDELLKNGLDADTYVWCEEFSDWTQAKNVPELQSVLDLSDEEESGKKRTNGGGRTKEHTTKMLAASFMTTCWACVPWILFLLFYDRLAMNMMFGGVNQIIQADIIWPAAVGGTYFLCIFLGLLSILKAAKADRYKLIGEAVRARRAMGASRGLLTFSTIFGLITLAVELYPIILPIFL